MTPEEIRSQKFVVLTSGLNEIVLTAQESVARVTAKLNEFVSDRSKMFVAAHELEWMGDVAHNVAEAFHVGRLYNSLIKATLDGTLLTRKMSPEETLEVLHKDLASAMLNDRFRGGSTNDYANAFDAAKRAAASTLAGDNFSKLEKIKYKLAAVDAEQAKLEEVSANSGC